MPVYEANATFILKGCSNSTFQLGVCKGDQIENSIGATLQNEGKQVLARPLPVRVRDSCLYVCYLGYFCCTKGNYSHYF